MIDTILKSIPRITNASSGRGDLILIKIVCFSQCFLRHWCFIKVFQLLKSALCCHTGHFLYLFEKKLKKMKINIAVRPQLCYIIRADRGKHLTQTKGIIMTDAKKTTVEKLEND